MQKIVLFIEPVIETQFGTWQTPSKIGYSYMNRFAIDEDGCHEIVKVYELEKAYDWYDTKLTVDDWNSFKG